MKYYFAGIAMHPLVLCCTHCQMKTDILERDWPSAALVERHKDGIRLMFANGRYASFWYTLQHFCALIILYMQYWVYFLVEKDFSVCV